MNAIGQPWAKGPSDACMYGKCVQCGGGWVAYLECELPFCAFQEATGEEIERALSPVEQSAVEYVQRDFWQLTCGM